MLQRQVELHPDPIATRLPPGLQDQSSDPTVLVEDVTILYGSHYYERLIELLGNSIARVDICMFHIALPSPGHPTFRLLDAVKAAQYAWDRCAGPR